MDGEEKGESLTEYMNALGYAIKGRPWRSSHNALFDDFYNTHFLFELEGYMLTGGILR